MSTCRDCGADIRFVELHTGQVVPIDALVSRLGSIGLLDGAWRVVEPQDVATRYTNHFATCPVADDFKEHA